MNLSLNILTLMLQGHRYVWWCVSTETPRTVWRCPCLWRWRRARRDSASAAGYGTRRTPRSPRAKWSAALTSTTISRPTSSLSWPGTRYRLTSHTAREDHDGCFGFCPKLLHCNKKIHTKKQKQKKKQLLWLLELFYKCINTEICFVPL